MRFRLKIDLDTGKISLEHLTHYKWKKEQNSSLGGVKMNLDREIIKQIKDIASGFDYIEKVILFGSRVRGDNRERSDIDLAVYSGEDITEFVDLLETQVRSLLEFDISDINQLDDLVFKQEVETEGVVIYEKSEIQIH